MPSEVDLRCRCGAMRGIMRGVAPTAGNRLVCLCDDCQTYGHWLGPEHVLDENGGTEIYQTTPSRVEITEGVEHLRCLRLSPSGLMRWYADCCRTPVANTLARPRMPFAGVHMRFVDPSLDDLQRDELFGPILARVQARWGAPPLPPDAHPRAPLWLIGRATRQLLRGFWTGAHAPSPFVDAAGSPVVVPQVLELAQRQWLRARAHARRSPPAPRSQNRSR